MVSTIVYVTWGTEATRVGKLLTGSRQFLCQATGD